MRVIVTGSRNWDDFTVVWIALTGLLADHPTDLTVVHGGCPTGADHYAAAWAAQYRSVDVEPWPADWHRHGRAAGPLRNQQMVDAGADLVLAFFQPGAANRGTADCVRRAEAAGIPVRRYPQETDHG